MSCARIARETNLHSAVFPSRWDAQTNVYALERAFAYDPDTYLWLAEECACGPVDPVANRAVELLAGVDFVRAAPALRHCVTEGASKYAPAQALAILLAHDWPGRDAFAIAQLGACSRRTQETAARWLERQDERVLSGVAAYLDHADAKRRALAAIASTPALRQHANNLLAQLAALRGLTSDQLTDAAIPTFGFDAHSERTFDYGPRQFIARLGVGGALTLSERRPGATPKPVKSHPQPTRRDDARLGEVAHAEWPALKAQAKDAAAMQGLRLQHAMLTGRAWDVVQWRALFQQHPLLRPLATTLVWGLLADDRRANDDSVAPYVSVFRPLEDSMLTDADDAPVTLPNDGAIRLVHPAELSVDAVTLWRAHLADYEIKQAFTQMNRTDESHSGVAE